MNVNPKTMLFENLNKDDKMTLKTEIEDIVFYGEINWHSKYLIEWLETVDENLSKTPIRIITVSSIYPIRALYSLL